MNYDKGYYDSQEFREILAKYEQAVKQNAMTYFGINELADLLAYGMSTDKIDIAKNALSIAKSQHPNTVDCKKMEIKFLLSRGEAGEVLKMFEEIGKPDIELSLLKAEAHVISKELQEAQEITVGVLKKLNPEDEFAYYALEILLDCGLAQDVLKYCEKVLKASPDIKSILEIKAESLIELQENQKAVDIYNKLLDEDPYNTLYWEQLGHIYYMTDKYGKALECFEYEAAINTDIPYARIMQAFCYYRMRDYRHAGAIFNEFAGRVKKDITSLFYQSLILYKEGKPLEALNSFTTNTEYLQEGSIEKMLSRINKAMILDELNKPMSADDALSMALIMRPNDTRQLIFHDTHLYELKCKECMTFDEMNRNDSAGWNEAEELYQLGVHLVRYNHPTLAKRVFNYIREMFADPTDVDAYIAYTCWYTNEKEHAKQAVKRALEGRSFQVFDLFGIPYDANISAEDFIMQINEE